MLNGQVFSWSNIESGVPQRSILGPSIFLIYINDLSEGLTTNVKLFADNVLLYSVVDNINLSTTNLNSDLRKINPWASQWKMTFNLDPNKQAQEVIFSRKIKKASHPPLNLNNNSVSLLRKLQNNVPRAPLVTIFINPHLHYGDILYDQTFNSSFHEKLESIQCDAALLITDAIRRSSREKLYQELGFESPQ